MIFCWRLCRRYSKTSLLYLVIVFYLSLLVYALTNKNQRAVYNMPDFHIRPSSNRTCELNVADLDLMHIDMSEEISLESVIRLRPYVAEGGKGKPEDCESMQKVAIIVPYRDRFQHLLVMLKRIHDILHKQKVFYQLFVVEQSGDDQFNRGRLLNIGVHEALKEQQFDCFIFHDVDLLPEHDGNIYMCDAHLRHLASAIDEMRYHVMYSNYAGGVSAISNFNFHAVNGFSNDYWGWGSEDDDFSARTMEYGLLITRPPEHIGRFKMVRHYKQWRSDNGYALFLTWRSRWKQDGINNVHSKYSLISKVYEKLYTNITVDIGPSPSQQLDTSGVQKESWWWFLTFFFP